MTAKPIKRKSDKPVSIQGYDGLLSGMVSLIEEARRVSARTVNAIMTATYWEIGRRIVENEQGGKRRAGYGEALLKQLSADLASRFGRGFAKSNLYQMRTFYLTYQDIFQTAFGKSKSRKFQTPSGKSQPHNSQTPSAELTVQAISERFPLPWSAYVRLLSLKSKQARAFYEEEALRGGWSVRQLNRQIESQFYERTALSKNKAAMLTRGAKPKPQDAITPEEQIKDPYVLEFLSLKDEYSESELEEALILHLEHFLLELGGDFTFE